MAKHHYEFDLVTLGAGSGGTRASRFSAQKYGAKVACVELPFGFISSDQIGGAGGRQPGMILLATLAGLAPTGIFRHIMGQTLFCLAQNVTVSHASNQNDLAHDLLFMNSRPNVLMQAPASSEAA